MNSAGIRRVAQSTATRTASPRSCSAVSSPTQAATAWCRRWRTGEPGRWQYFLSSWPRPHSHPIRWFRRSRCRPAWSRVRTDSCTSGSLRRFPFPVGKASVFRVPPEGGTPQVYATGFTNIIDIAFGNNGEMYVLEVFKNGLLAGPPGRLIRVATNGVRTTVADGLILPGGVAVGADGAVYVTNFGTSATNGQVLRIAP